MPKKAGCDRNIAKGGNNVKFAVIGAGPAGLAMAGHLAILGQDVRVYGRDPEVVRGLAVGKQVVLRGAIEGVGSIQTASTRMEDVVPDTDAIIVVVPAQGHQTVAGLAAPYLRDGQIVLLMPGRTAGCLEFAHCLREANVKANIELAESQTIIHTCRGVRGEGHVNILAVKRSVDVASLPSNRIARIIDFFRPLFPQLNPVEDTRVTGLGNVGAILHPAPALFNLGRIETSATSFRHYTDGISPSVAKFLERIDAERCEVAAALGVRVASTVDWLHTVYGTSGKDLYDCLQATEYYKTIQAPSTIEHRYLFEDVPTGLVPISELGRACGVSTPFTDLIIELASRVLGRNFRVSGRNLIQLGLAKRRVEGIVDAFRRGIVFRTRSNRNTSRE